MTDQAFSPGEGKAATAARLLLGGDMAGRKPAESWSPDHAGARQVVRTSSFSGTNRRRKSKIDGQDPTLSPQSSSTRPRSGSSVRRPRDSITIGIDHLHIGEPNESDEEEAEHIQLRSTTKGPRIVGDYEVHDTIGTGAFAHVKKGIDIRTGDEVALKIMDRKRLKFKDEVDIWRHLTHKNIVPVCDVVEEGEKVYIVMQLMKGGELEEALNGQPDEHFNERDASSIVHEVLCGLEFLHSQGIVHRDLKPANILFNRLHDVAESELDLEVKITDFGLAAVIDPSTDDQLLYTNCGTAFYLAPEVVKGHGYSHGVDMWSVGILAYQLCIGKVPFLTDNMGELMTLVSKGVFTFPKTPVVSENARSFISRLLQINPTERYSAREALRHPWIESRGDSETDTREVPTVRDMMRAYLAEKSFMSAARVMVAVLRFSAPLRARGRVMFQHTNMESEEAKGDDNDIMRRQLRVDVGGYATPLRERPSPLVLPSMRDRSISTLVSPSNPKPQKTVLSRAVSGSRIGTRQSTRHSQS